MEAISRSLHIVLCVQCIQNKLMVVINSLSDPQSLDLVFITASRRSLIANVFYCTDVLKSPQCLSLLASRQRSSVGRRRVLLAPQVNGAPVSLFSGFDIN